MKWKYRGGPKNNGRFSIVTKLRFEIGRNHRPMPKMARMRFLSKPKKGILA